MLAESLKDDLESFGAEVLGPVPSVGKAIAIIAERPQFDCAVLDINLGGEMVFPAANDLRRRGISFVFLTGYDRSPVAISFGDVPVFEKPVEPSILVRALLAEFHRRGDTRV